MRTTRPTRKQMDWLQKEDGFALIDQLAKAHTPFLFIISYDKSKIFVQSLDKLASDIFYKFEDALFIIEIED